MKVFKLNDIPEFSKRERIVVVGIIGKSPHRYPNKTTPLLSAVQSQEVSKFMEIICCLLFQLNKKQNRGRRMHLIQE